MSDCGPNRPRRFPAARRGLERLRNPFAATQLCHKDELQTSRTSPVPARRARQNGESGAVESATADRGPAPLAPTRRPPLDDALADRTGCILAWNRVGGLEPSSAEPSEPARKGFAARLAKCHACMGAG